MMEYDEGATKFWIWFGHAAEENRWNKSFQMPAGTADECWKSSSYEATRWRPSLVGWRPLQQDATSNKPMCHDAPSLKSTQPDPSGPAPGSLAWCFGGALRGTARGAAFVSWAQEWSDEN